MTTHIDELTPDDLEGAAREYGAIIGLTQSEVMNLLYEDCRGSRDTRDLALKLAEISAINPRVEAALSRSQDAGGWTETTGTYGYVGLTDYSAEQRRQLAARGRALEDGSYPIDTLQDAKNAAALIKSHHGNWQAATRLLAKICKQEGWSNPLDTDNDSDRVSTSHMGDMIARHVANYTPEAYLARERAAAERQAMALAGSSSDDVVALTMTADLDVESVMIRNPQIGWKSMVALAGASYPDNAYPPSYAYPDGPAGADVERYAAAQAAMVKTPPKRMPGYVSTDPQQDGSNHDPSLPGCDGGGAAGGTCARDHGVSAKGGAIDPRIAALMDKMFGGEKIKSGNFSSGPGQMAPGARRY